MEVWFVNMSLDDRINPEDALALSGRHTYIKYETPYDIDPTSVWEWATMTIHPTQPTLFIVQGAGGFSGGNPQVNVAVVGDAFIDAVTSKHSCFFKPNNTYGLPKHMRTKWAQIGAALHAWEHLVGSKKDNNERHEWWRWIPPAGALPPYKRNEIK